MLIFSNDIALFGKKIITDLASRSSFPTRESYSPYIGMQHIVNKYSVSSIDTDINPEYLFEKQVDFDADVARPFMSEQEYDDTESTSSDVAVYNPSRDPVNFDGYYRRLEDITSQYLQNYLGNMVYKIYNQTDGIHEYEAKHRAQPTLVSLDDSEDVTELADLAVDTNNDWSEDVKAEAQRRLPYTLKRLHTMSKYSKIHMLSYVCAYHNALLHNQAKRMSGSTKTLTAQDVIREGVWKCDSSGNATTRVSVENKNIHALNLFTWVTGNSEQYASYHRDMTDFLHYVKVLNIDISNDDMSQYGEDFIKGLVITTVTPNSQYDDQVFNAICANTNTARPKKKKDPLKSTLQTFSQVCILNPDIVEALSKQNDAFLNHNMNNAAALLNLYFTQRANIYCDANLISWDNGWLCYDGELMMFPCDWVTPGASNANYFIASELGYAVMITDTLDAYMMTLDNALANGMNYLIRHDSDYKPANWKCFPV